MARRRRRSDGTRDTSAIANSLLRSDLLDLVRPMAVRTVYEPSFDVRELEDRREFHPLLAERPARAVRRSASRLTVPYSSYVLPSRLRFEDPRLVAVCVRRKERREVIFAKGRSGAGGRSPRWSEYSSVDCK